MRLKGSNTEKSEERDISHSEMKESHNKKSTEMDPASLKKYIILT